MSTRAVVGSGAGRAPHDLRVVPAAAAVWLAGLTGQLLGWWWASAIGLLTVAGGAVMAVGGPRRLRTAAVVTALVGVVTALPLAGEVRDAQHDPLAEHAGQGSHAVARVTATDRARPVGGDTSDEGDPDGTGVVVIRGQLESVDVYGDPVDSRGRVVLLARGQQWAQVLPGQQLTATGRLAAPRRAELTVAVLHVRGPPTEVTTAPWWQRAAESVRVDLRSAAAVLDDDEAGLLPGLVVGDTSAMPPRVEQDFLDSGLSHLVAVSGSNVVIVVGAALLVLRALRLGPRTCALGGGVVLLGYVVLVGYEPSVLRAGVMGGVGLLALLLGRHGSAMPALAFAVGLLVVVDPAMATSIGFALSAVATGALVLVAPGWAAAMRRRRVPPGVAEALAIPLSAFVVTAPIIAGMAGRVSLVTVVANVLAAPVVAVATVLGALAAATAPAAPALAELLVRLADPAVSWLVFVARQAASVPGAVVGWPGGWSGGLLLAVTAGVLVAALRLRWVRVLVAMLLVVVIVAAVPATVVSPGWPPRDWAFAACDVGQGDALVLPTGEPDTAVVVDTGTDTGAIDRCLGRLGVQRVSLLILSHLHGDHVGGIDDVVDGRSVGAVAVSAGRAPRAMWDVVTTAAAEADAPVATLRAGDRMRWPELELHVLGPRYVPPDTEGEGDGTDINNASLVLSARTAAGTVLLTGDIELAAQADLLAADADLDADVLKVPHHGSRHTDEEFLDAVSPRVAVFSVGEDNRHGHPHSSIVRRLRDGGATIARTDTSGDLAVIPDADGPAVVSAR